MSFLQFTSFFDAEIAIVEKLQCQIGYSVMVFALNID
jgi:hypothetical protein